MIAETVIITHQTGLHARPAALLVKVASGFASDVALFKDDRTFNAKSILSIMGAGIKQGDTATLQVSGPDEQAALAAVLTLIRSDFKEY